MHSSPTGPSKNSRQAAIPTSRLTAEFEATPHGWFWLVYPAFLLKIRKQEANNMTDIRNALERRVQAQALE